MLLGTILGWIVAGLIVGGLARFLIPGRQNMGLGMTIVLGIVGAMVGGFLASLMFGPALVTDGTGTYAVHTAWPGWIVATLCAAILLWLATANSRTKSVI